MSGPIVRTGTTPEFWKNWDKVFGGNSGGKKSDGAKKKSAGTATAKKKSPKAKTKSKPKATGKKK